MCGKTKKLNFIHPAFCLGVWRKTLCPRLPYYYFFPPYFLPSQHSIGRYMCMYADGGVRRYRIPPLRIRQDLCAYHCHRCSISTMVLIRSCMSCLSRLSPYMRAHPSLWNEMGHGSLGRFRGNLPPFPYELHDG